MFVKNITLSVDDAVLGAVRLHAAERNTTVNALVRRYLTGIAARDDRARKARKRIRQLSEQSMAKVGSRTWTRADLHER